MSASSAECERNCLEEVVRKGHLTQLAQAQHIFFGALVKRLASTERLERRASRLEEKRRTVAERGRAFNERLEQQMKPVEGLERSKTSPGAISLNGDQ